MATLDTSKKIMENLKQLNNSVLIGKAYPLGSGGSMFTGMGKSFICKGVVTGKAIAFKHKGTWRVIQG